MNRLAARWRKFKLRDPQNKKLTLILFPPSVHFLCDGKSLTRGATLPVKVCGTIRINHPPAVLQQARRLSRLFC